MPRHGTSDAHAELAVELYRQLLAHRSWGLDRSWVAITLLLMTCNVWRDGEWRALHGAPVLRESNDYRLTAHGTPNKALSEALQVRGQIAAELAIDADMLCAEMGQFFSHPEIEKLQPNNPRGHAFRSLVAETLARFGDPKLDVSEEVFPRDLFPGYDFGNRSKDARIDIVVKRGPRPVALITTRWTYRHDRVDIIDEARAYMPAARSLNRDARFFGVTAEFGPARLKKVIGQTSPAMRNAAIDRLVHLKPELPSKLVGKNGDLTKMWSLEQMVRDSYDWR